MNRKYSVYLQLLAAFGFFTILLALALGAAAWFSSSRLNIELLGRRSATVLDMLIQAERHDRSGVERQLDAEELIAALDLKFLAGKELPVAWRKLSEGLHIFRHEGKFVLVKSDNGILFALSGSLAPPNGNLGDIAEMLLFCAAFGLLAAIPLAFILARRLAAPILLLAHNLDFLNSTSSNVPCKLTKRPDEIGLLARAMEQYQRRAHEYVEREKFFTAAASHELRTPLAVLAQGLELLESQLPASGASMATTVRLQTALTRMGKTLEALLSLARAEAQPLREINPRGLCERIIADLLIKHSSSSGCQNPAEERGQAPVIKISGQSKPVMAQPQLAEAVFRNLLENALLHGLGQQIFLRFENHALEIGNLARMDSESVGGQGFGILIAARACERMGWKLAPLRRGEEMIFNIIWEDARASSLC